MDFEDDVKLPLEIQMWLLEQSRYFMRPKLDDRKYEAACVLFEKILCGYNKRELKGMLQVAYNDLIRQLERIDRWDFVKAACPYVIQCTAQILSNRSNLGMSDRLSVAVTKFLSTAHWCFIDAPSDCGLDPKQVLYPPRTVDLFIQLLIPCAHNIHEDDLTFSLKSGILIWQPLWKNLCPDIPSFKRPVLLEKIASQHSVASMRPKPKRGVLKYFDIMVLKSLSTSFLCEDSISWCLIYILQILQSELFLFCDVSESWTSIRNVRFGAKRNVAVQHSMPVFQSHFARSSGSAPPSPRSPDGIEERSPSKKTSLDSEPVYLSDEYSRWLKEDGRLHHSAVLDLVYQVTQNATLKLCETLLYTLHVLLELGIINASVKDENLRDIDVNLEIVVNCLLDLITMIGCSGNDSGMRGSKGQNLRHLSHDMFAKIVSVNSEQTKLLVIAYIRRKSVKDVLNFLHSFTGFCFGKIEMSPVQMRNKTSLADLGTAHRSLQSEASDGSVTSDAKEQNEESLFSWICIPLLDKLMSEEKFCKEPRKLIVTKLLTYITNQHPKTMRKMIMNGVLNSFSKSDVKKSKNDKDSERNAPPQEKAFDANSYPKARGKLKTRSTPTVESRIRRKLPLSRSKGIDESSEHFMEIAGSPDSASSSQTPLKGGKSVRESSSLSKAFGNNNRFKIFKGTKRSRLASVIYSPVDSGDSPVFVDKVAQTNMVDLEALLSGMKQFRFITCFVAPGHVPETALIGALMNLRAPVLARAALLFECCRFVHLCNTGTWDPLSRPENTPKKDVAMMFYKWGIAVGAKLEELIQEENESISERLEDPRKFEQPEQNYLHEGELSAVSNHCPYGIKLLACQLLLEITSFLRDNYLSYLTDREQSITVTSRNNSMDQRKISSVSLLRGRKSVGSKHPAAPLIEVQDESGSSSSNRRKSSAVGRYGISTSPKYQRKISRKTSRAHFLQSERRPSRPHKGNQHITSSFDEDEEIPYEATDFPWVSAVVSFVKSTNVKITELRNENWNLRIEASWQNMRDGLIALYKPKEDGSGSLPRRSALIGEFSIFPEEVKEENEDPIFEYLRCQVTGLQHAPFSVICKSALVTDHMQILEVMPCAWRMLLHHDQDLVSAAAATVLIAGVQLCNFVTSFIKKEMSKPDPNDRAQAVLRFGILWKYRFNAFNKMEKNAVAILKVPPPKIDYTLPSPLIGRDPPLTTDAPWVAGSPFPWETDDSEIIQSEWYYDEEKRLAAKEKRRAEKLTELRKGFRLRNISLSNEACVETRGKTEEDEDEDTWLPQQLAQDATDEAVELFPPALCAVAFDVIRLMDDTALSCNGKSVGNIAYHIVWDCLVDEPDLFFRKVYENITKTNKQEEVLLVLRKLIQQMPVLPPIAGTMLFNNLVGLIMYYNRTNKPGCQERISSVLHILWQVVPSVSDLFLKDMKQILRKENCEQVFMITANVPGIKEIRVTYGKNTEKFEVKDNMTFASLIEECEKSFDVFDTSFVLVDKHSGWILENTRLIRDTFAFKRGFAAPVVKLATIERRKCYEERQRQALHMKLSEIGRLNLAGSIFNVFPNQRHITFLFLELFKQNAFPRKAIEFEFALCQGRGLATELLGLDVILKDTWVKFICTLLGHLDESTIAGDEIETFLNVLNGALLLLCDNVMILRSCLGGFLNISRHFGQIFAVNGYQYILPTMLKVYAQHQDNILVKEAIEFTIGQFLKLHQSPFLMQLFASVAPMLQSEVTQELLSCNVAEQIPSNVFFKLLLSLDRRIDDVLGILAIVDGEKPIRAYDSVCKIENIDFSMIDIAIRLAVTVIAYRPTSSRGIQMLIVVSAIMPHYLYHLKTQTDLEKDADEEGKGQEMMAKELKQLRILFNYLKVIIENSKHLGSFFSSEFCESTDSSDSPFDDEAPAAKQGILSLSWWGNALNGFRTMLGLNSDRTSFTDDMDRISVSDEIPVSLEERQALRRFCLPRMSLLFLASEFVINGAARTREIKELVRRKVAAQDIAFDRAQASILTDVMSSLLSLAPRNQEMLSNIGLERFMLQALASIKWTDEKEAFFVEIVCKVNRMLQKILSHPEQQDSVNWNVLEIYLRGINVTILKQRELSSGPQIKELIDSCVQLIVSDTINEDNFAQSLSFTNTAAKLAARLIQTNPKAFSLPVVCGDYHLVAGLNHLEKFLIHWFLPLCIRLGTGRYDYSSMSADDVEFAISVILSFLSPHESCFGSKISLSSTRSLEFTHDTNFTAIRTRKTSQSMPMSPKTYKILFLGLKILIVAFEDKFAAHWKTTAEVMEVLAEKNKDDPSIWDFFHFIVDNRSALLVHLLPVLIEKVREEQNLSNEIRSQITRIERDLWNPVTRPCKGDVLKHLLDDLSDITHGKLEDDTLLELSSPPRLGRSRSKSTHNDRTVMLTEFDKQWENYDKPQEGLIDPFDDETDGSQTNARRLSRKRSSKKVTIASEPIVMEEVPTRKSNSDDSVISRSGSKKILKRRPLLQRQSAEEENDSEVNEASDEKIETNRDHENQKEKVHNFNRQRFQNVRKRDDSRTFSSRKKDRWRRDNSYRYRKRMEHQVSFNEEDELDGVAEQQQQNMDFYLTTEETVGSPDIIDTSNVNPIMEDDDIENTGIFYTNGEIGRELLTFDTKLNQASSLASAVLHNHNDSEKVSQERLKFDKETAVVHNDASMTTHIHLNQFNLEIHKAQHLQSISSGSFFYHGTESFSPSASSDVPLIDDCSSSKESFLYEDLSKNIVVNEKVEDLTAVNGLKNNTSQAGQRRFMNGNAVHFHENETETIEEICYFGKEDCNELEKTYV